MNGIRVCRTISHILELVQCSVLVDSNFAENELRTWRLRPNVWNISHGKYSFKNCNKVNDGNETKQEEQDTYFSAL